MQGDMARSSAEAFLPRKHRLGSYATWWGTYGRRLANSVRHDVRQRYAGSHLGVVWAILYPLALLCFYAGIYVFVFKVRVPNLQTEHYTILVMTGLSAVIMFSESLTSGIASLSNQKGLLLNTVFPAELLAPRAVLASQVPSLAALVLTVVAAIIAGAASPAALIVVPVTWLLLIMFMMGLAWIFSLVSLLVRDISHAVGIVNMAVMILSPMAFTPEMIPDGLRFMLWFNPMSYFILCLQAPIALGVWPSPVAMVGAAVLGIGMFFLGRFFFRRARFVFVEYM